VGNDVAKRAGGKAYYMISAVSQKYNIHHRRHCGCTSARAAENRPGPKAYTPVLRGGPRAASKRSSPLTRDLGVNLAGVEIILNMRRKIDRCRARVNEFMDYVEARARARHRMTGNSASNTALVQVIADRSRAARCTTPRRRRPTSQKVKSSK
jgi:MerR family transcriptional regulator/heat shock protein HspR